MKWYMSDFHQDLMKKFMPNFHSGRPPLADVTDENAPILAIASVTSNEKAGEGHSPFKQIAIELYQPIGGGLGDRRAIRAEQDEDSGTEGEAGETVGGSGTRRQRGGY
ncbi:MAG TPA: hypothetical protein VGJ26_20895 [Pirellulales bacterium]